jgi:glucose/arabinose dehydrogenase
MCQPEQLHIAKMRCLLTLTTSFLLLAGCAGRSTVTAGPDQAKNLPAHHQKHEHAKHGGHGAATTQAMPQVPAPDASAAKVPDGFKVKVVMHGLTYPTSVEFDDAGNLYVAESGYSYGDPSAKPRILRVNSSGQIETLAQGELNGPINDLLWHDGKLYISHRGKISVMENGKLRDLVTGLPSHGDHHNNQLTAGPDGKIYFAQGTATNSGVVGIDNYKMGWLKDHPDFHDVSPNQIKLVGKAFETPNPLTESEAKAKTSAFHPFGKAAPQGSTIEGYTKANGTVLRMNPDGSQLEVYAWGLRNPYGLLFSPDGTLYATENGFDIRGSRPIANDKEDIYIIKQGAWYGWPDYAMGKPVTDPQFKPEGKPQPQFLLGDHPPVEQPWMTFPKHASITKLDFATSDAFGKGRMFVAFFGHMTPMTGKPPEEHGGHRVLAIDPKTKKSEVFFTKASHGHSGGGQSHGHGESHGQHDSSSAGGHGGGSGGGHDESVTPGPRRLVDVRFTPNGQALYIADFGTMVIEGQPKPVPGTGVIWRIVPQNSQPQGLPANLRAPESR